MIVLDTLKLADLLKTKATFTDTQAAAFVATFSEFIAMSYGNLATKDDIAAMVAQTNARFVETEAKLDAKFADASAKLTTAISNVRDTLSRWMFGLIITLVITRVTLLTKLR